MSELVIEREYEVADIDTGAGDGWSIYGRILPFGARQTVRDGSDTPAYVERFDPHSFDRDVAKGGRWVNLRVGHHGADHDAFLGRCTGLEAHPGGLYATFRITERDHPSADAARAGELRSWSVGAKVFRSRRVVDSDGTEIVNREVCAINHVAATASPQYAGAGVLLVRDHQMIELPPPSQTALVALRARLAADRERVAAKMSAARGSVTY